MGDAVVVTGAAGLVGRACVAALRSNGLDAWGISRSAREGHAIDLSLEFETGLAKLAQSAGRTPDAIIHLAAAVPHDPNYPDVAATADLTRAIDRHVCQAARFWGSRVIYMSTCGLYERSDPGIKTPSSPVAPARSPYFEAKWQGERLFGEMGAAIFRLAAPVGPGIRPTVVLSRFVARCRADLPIEIWGSGLREQDFIHVDDVASLLAAAVREPAQGIFNCAGGRPVTMIELADEIVRILGKSAVALTGREDPCEGETARYSIESTRARFGWSPQIGLADMIRSL